MTLPHGWIEVHGWPWGDFIDGNAPERLLVQVCHVRSVVPKHWHGRLLTTLHFGGEYSHAVEESVVQVQELMAHALRQT